ncbi:glycosyl transferase [Acidisphaera rubrifaciens HS-AP3]|uniref:Glycosyl transferase n=2 Tax=Acidisphaera TaxID=50714 RepID=A0A0D6P7M7_9PROT|nr:glycosyl transferase [Acidisphaera rubrifaciens HS-AP3]
MRFATLANHYGDRYAHTICAMDGRIDCRERLDHGLDVSFLPAPAAAAGLIRRVRAYRHSLRRLRPDVLVTSNWGSIEWAMANATVRIPHVHMEDGFGPDESDRQLRRRVLTRRFVLRGATLVVPSRTLWHIARDVWAVPERGLRHIPNGVDLHRYAPAEQGCGAAPVIGTVAALRGEKRLDRLLHAAAQLARGHAFTLMIVGGGPQRTRLEALATALGIGARVVFTGPQPDPAACYNLFDVFALSSDTEQMPLSVLEAMGSGLPVVATDVGDVRRMLAEDNAPYVVARDAGAMATALQALLDQPERRRAIGAANRARAVAVFDQEKMFAAYAELFG